MTTNESNDITDKVIANIVANSPMLNITDFVILEYIEHSLYYERFAKSKFLSYELIIDTWTGLVNATKFCNQFNTNNQSSKKNFYSYLRVSDNREMIIEDYEELGTVVPLEENWRIIYNHRNNLYIIEGKQEAVEELGGTYVFYTSIYDIITWCSNEVKDLYYQYITLIHNYLQFKHNTKNLSLMQKINYNIQLPADYLGELKDIREKGKTSEYAMIDIFKQILPTEHYIEINKDCFLCKNIVIFTEYEENIDNINLNNHKPDFSIIISFIRQSSINNSKMLILINIDDFSHYIPLVVSMVKNCKVQSSCKTNVSESLGEIIKEQVNALIPFEQESNFKDLQEKVNSLSETKIQLNEKIEELDREIKNKTRELGFDIDLSKTLENINKLKSSHKYKKKYLEYFNDGKISSLPKKLVALVFN